VPAADGLSLIRPISEMDYLVTIQKQVVRTLVTTKHAKDAKGLAGSASNLDFLRFSRVS
jgi:hypothetical protein